MRPAAQYLNFNGRRRPESGNRSAFSGLRSPVFVFLFIAIVIPEAGICSDTLADAVSGATALTSDAGSDISSVFMPKKRFDIKGFLRGEAHLPALAGKDDSKNAFGSPDAYFGITANLETHMRFSDNFSAKADLRYRVENLGRDTDPDSYIGEHADDAFDLRQAYVKYRTDTYGITLGQQIFAWGTTDGVNPTNAMWPQNRTFVTSDRDDRRMGVPAAKADIFFQTFRVTGIWQPVFVSSRFRIAGLPDGAQINLNDARDPDSNFSDSTFAFKLSTSILSTDLSLSYSRGWSPNPDIVLDKVTRTSSGAVIDVSPVFNRVETIGFDFDSLLGPVIVRGEAAYLHVRSDDSNTSGHRKSEIQWIVGPEFSPVQDVTVNAQFGMTHVLGYEEIFWDVEKLKNSPRALVAAYNARLHRQLNRNNPMTTMRIDWHLLQQTLLLQFRGFYYIKDEELRLRPRAVYDITDRLGITLAADLAFGPQGSRFDKYGKNYNEVFTEMKFNF